MQDTDTTFRNARDNKLSLSDKSFTSLFRLTKVKPVDDYGNTLLHITTEHSNSKYVEELLNADYDPDAVNKFGKSAWDIAVSNQNKTILAKFVNHRVQSATKVLENRNSTLNETVVTLTKTRKELEDFVTDIDLQNKKLRTRISQYEATDLDRTKEITLLTRSKSSLLNEVSCLKRSVADIQGDNVVLKSTNKRLREDNDELKDANKKLRTSVDALLTASMK